MAEITVRAEQRTVDWDEGAVFTVERTEYVDRLIADGRLTELPTGGTIIDGLIDATPTEYAVPENLGTDPSALWVDDQGNIVEPPRAGKGSGAEIWRKFLDHHGVNYEKINNRDDLIELWENHQVAQAEAHSDADES